MHSSFTRGLIVGSIIGAAVGTIMNPDMTNGRSRRKIIRNGKNIMKRSGNLIGDIVDIFR